MTDDVTKQLIDRINAYLQSLPDQQEADDHESEDMLLSNAVNFVGTAANFAQLLGLLITSTGGVVGLSVLVGALFYGIQASLEQSNPGNSQAMIDILNGMVLVD